MKEQSVAVSMPRWYQDLSIPQMQNVFSLGDFIRADYAERVTGRTRRALCDIGVTSTFVKITPQEIRKSSRLTDLDPVKFLCEIYRNLTGSYFTEETYKKSYDCNERIILSAIAFLTLPEIVVELHRRLPVGATPKLPPKPLPQKPQRRIKRSSPYLESLFVKPDWLTYKKELYLWEKKIEAIPRPTIILPSFVECPWFAGISTCVTRSEEFDREETEISDSGENENIDNEEDEADGTDKDLEGGTEISKGESESKEQKKHSADIEKGIIIETEKNEGIDKLEKKKSRPGQGSGTTLISKKQSNVKDKVTLKNKLTGSQRQSKKQPAKSIVSKESRKTVKKKKSSERKEEREKSKKRNLETRRGSKSCDEISDNLEKKKEGDDPRKRVRSDKKFHLDGKETHLIVTGITENEDSMNVSITQQTSGIACVTPYNSDESFFQALKLSEPRKIYPRGRENLSRHWQEWFREIDEEFMKMDKESKKIIKSVDETLKLIGPETVCDGCCSCRQTRKTNMKYHKTKTPQMVIDSITVDGKRNKYVVGSLAMNSPGPSPSESMTDIPNVIDSHEKIINNKIISGVSNEKGETKYFISGVSKDIERVSRKIIGNVSLKKKKNVPPCGCAIEKMMNEGIMEIMSDDNIPWTKEDQICIGSKYRPEENASTSCQKYMGDKMCRRNPFKKKVDEQIKAKLREKENIVKDYYPPEKKNMYSLAAFQPCGDEDGMAICGGPWGAVNIPTEEELARREAEAKFILESPPCGNKPGRSICGAPFGSRHPIPKKPKKDDEDDEEESEDEEEEKKPRTREPRRRIPDKIEKQLNRDPRCSTMNGNSESITNHKYISEIASKIRRNRMAKKLRDDRKMESLKHDDENSDIELIEKSESRVSNRGRVRNSQSYTSSTGRIKSSDKVAIEKANEAEFTIKKDEVKNLKKQWNRMKTMANKLITSPVTFPEDPPKKCKRESEPDNSDNAKILEKDDSPEEGPFGWRTESQQALPAEKTLIYLVDPDEPMATIPVRPGGKACKCRENRNAKKKLLYNVAGLTKQDRRKRVEKISRIIDGLIYITPVPSVRNSEEYIPEYELYESPYEKCSRERYDKNFKYIQKYLGPKSLIKKKGKVPKSCKCSSVEEKIVDTSKQESEEIDEDLEKFESKDSSRVYENQGLIEFYSRCRDNVPCWLRCVEFSKYGCCISPKRLQVKKPVCECKYERKIVRREEEKKKWLSRQERLKTYKKENYIHVDGLSRPMQTESKLIISNVETIHGNNKPGNDDVQYCITGIKEDHFMTSGDCILSGIGMHTPSRTPEPSKHALPIPKLHHHWSFTNIRDPKAISGNKESSGMPRSTATNKRGRLANKIDNEVDVLFQNGQLPGRKLKIHQRSGKEGQASRRRGEGDTNRGKKSGPNSYQKGLGSHEGMQENPTAETTKSDNGSISSQNNNSYPSGAKQQVSSLSELNKLMEIELGKMASEGFLFAKLPACHQMPQLQWWIMYRYGFALPQEEKKNLMDRSLKIWESAGKEYTDKIKVPPLGLPKEVMKNLDWDKADAIKREVTSKRALFYSNLRKSRVLRSRKMWALMEFGKFPGVAFKKAYFTYHASKESDGFVFKPWENVEKSKDLK